MWYYLELAWNWIDHLLYQVTLWMDRASFLQMAAAGAAIVAVGYLLLRGFGSRTSY